MDLAAITGIVSGALSSLKAARDLAKDTTDLELKGKLSEVFDLLLELKESVSTLADENKSLKAQLKEKDQLEGPFAPFGYFYKSGDREHPLCSICAQKAVPVQSYMGPLHQWRGGQRRTCRTCDQSIYEVEMQPIHTPIRPARRNYRQ